MEKKKHNSSALLGVAVAAAFTLGAGVANANTWVSARDGYIPEGAIPGGKEQAGVLYICRARFRNGVHPGKIRRQFGGCNIGWGGREHTVRHYQVLTRYKRRVEREEDDRPGGGALWESHRNGRTPRDAMRGGEERNGTRLYVCRARFKGGVHFGKIRREFGGCNIGWGGREHTVRTYEVLITGNMFWEPNRDGRTPSDAVGGGRERNGTPLYVCRARFNGGLHPGKVRKSFRGCNIGWGGREHTVPKYDVLIRE